MPVTTRGAPGTLRNIFNGHICIAYEDLGGLCKRLETVEGALKHTKFSWSRLDDGRVEAVDPLGNRWLAESRPRDERDERGFQPGPRSPCHGITAIEFNAPKGTTHHIAEYYRRYFNAEASAEGGVARVATGPRQELRFREDPTCWLGQPGVAYENQTYGLHIAVYLYDHLSAMQRLATDNMLWGNPRYEKLDEGLGLSQFRCKDIMAQVVAQRERREAGREPGGEIAFPTERREGTIEGPAGSKVAIRGW